MLSEPRGGGGGGGGKIIICILFLNLARLTIRLHFELMTGITWPFDVNIFEKLRFRPSTLNHRAGVFEFLHSGDRFWKAPFSVVENAVLVWTFDQIGENKMRFVIYPD